MTTTVTLEEKLEKLLDYFALHGERGGGLFGWGRQLLAGKGCV